VIASFPLVPMLTLCKIVTFRFFFRFIPQTATYHRVVLSLPAFCATYVISISTINGDFA
jgi:hypothetical protein